MKIKSFKFIFTSVITMMLLVVTGCAANKNLSFVNNFTIQENSTKDIKITKTRAYIDDGTFVVSGKLKRQYIRKSCPGHIDIAVIDPDGSVFDHVSTKLTLPFNSRSKRKNSTFEAQFTQMPPKGSTIRINFHNKSSLNNKQFDCGVNAALSTNVQSE